MTIQNADVGAQEEKAMFSSLGGLRSAKSTHRLNQIARVKANGVGDHVSLPQLVVCGDQSAGKSSVLEGITGIPFPRQDGVCTKFATEIILHHDVERTRITATVIPHRSRNQAQREGFQAYHRVLGDFTDLPGVIAEAGALMRLRGPGADDGPAFAEDVLRIEVIGNTGLHLTVVDLPGLIAVANEEQTDEDVQLVARLVDTYLQSPRTIILAVVQANNDIANQGIIQRARKFDRAGQRTVGIITKPDLINQGTEGRIALLAKNQDTTKLKLGYFLLKNPSPAQLQQGITLSQRKREELDFFCSPGWKEHRLDPDRLGVNALREFLQDLLDRHVERELPKVRNEIKSLLAETEARLANLGDERPTVAHMRMFLTRRSMEFHCLAQAALDGNYHERDAGFFNDSGGYSTRLRAEVHRLNGSFAAYMGDNGQKMKLSNRNPSGCDTVTECESDSETGQLLVTKQELDSWVKEVLQLFRYIAILTMADICSHTWAGAAWQL
jgi:GTPase SAR1 family protein